MTACNIIVLVLPVIVIVVVTVVVTVRTIDGRGRKSGKLTLYIRSCNGSCM